MENTNEKIVELLKNEELNGSSLIDFLSEQLDITKNSAYRRVSSFTPFSMEEVAILSRKIGFSIDKVLSASTEKHIVLETPEHFNLQQNPMELYRNSLKYMRNVMQKLSTAKEKSINLVLAEFPLRYASFPHLFKMDYLMFLYSHGAIAFGSKFSDLQIPKDIVELQQECVQIWEKIDNVNVIFDERFISRTLQKYKHFYLTHVLNDEDIKLLYQDSLKLIEMYSSAIQQGKNRYGSNYKIYISSIDVGNAAIHCNFDRNNLSLLWLFDDYPICIENNDAVYGLAQQSFSSKSRYSQLITGVNDLQNYALLEKLYEEVHNFVQL